MGKATQGAYLQLEERVELPVDEVSQPWQPVYFKARCRSFSRTDSRARIVPLRGILLRLPGGGAQIRPENLKAFCLICPHEFCELNFSRDPKQIRLDSGGSPANPVLVCPCHASVFDPLSDGDVISGPAERGAYRFRLQLENGRVQITDVEAEAARLD